ncbi:MAG: hypothetical protein ABDI19_11025 [Armatimonadota bacterium]
MRTIELVLSDEEYESLCVWAERSGFSLDRLIREIIRPALEKAQRVYGYRKLDLYSLTAEERAALYQAALRELEQIHQRYGEPVVGDTTAIIREFRERDA